MGWGAPQTGRVVVGHVFTDLAGRPNSRQTRHFAGHPAEIPALTLHQLGLMDGFPDGTFGPEKTITASELSSILARAFARKPEGVSVAVADRPITQDEAVAMVVSALGYASDAKALGGRPKGFMKVGNLKFVGGGSRGTGHTTFRRRVRSCWDARARRCLPATGR